MPINRRTLEEITAAAELAAAKDPRNVAAIIFAADRLYREGEIDRAAALAQRAAEIAPDDFQAVRFLSSMLAAAGKSEAALAAAEKAVRLNPTDATARLHLAGLLVGAERWREAARHLLHHVNLEHASAHGWRLLSVVLTKMGRVERAIDAIGRALAMEPECVDYHMQLASLFASVGRHADSLEELARVRERDPSNAVAARMASGLYHVIGDAKAALEEARRACRLAPGDAEYRQNLAHMEDAAAFGTTADGLNEIWIENEFSRWTDVDRSARQRVRPPREDGFLAALRTKMRVIFAVMLRETRAQHGRSRLGYAWAVIEPIAHVLTLGSVFNLFNHGAPPIGNNYFLYYLTGLLPFLMFNHTAEMMMSSITAGTPVLQLPKVTRVDVELAQALLCLATEIVVGLIVFSGAALLGQRGMPYNMLVVMQGIAALWFAGLGIGAINAVVSQFWPAYTTFYNSITRLLYFASGIYYSPMVTPDWVRNILVWNPVLQGVEWFRSGFFEGYAPHWLDRAYLIEWGVCAVILGFSLERAARRRIILPA